MITAYCFNSKKKEPFHGMKTIRKTSNNKYIIEGKTKEGHNISTFISRDKYNSLLKDNKHLEKGDGLLQSLGVKIPENVSNITDKIPIINWII